MLRARTVPNITDMVDAGKANGRVAIIHFFSQGGGGSDLDGFSLVVSSILKKNLSYFKRTCGASILWD